MSPAAPHLLQIKERGEEHEKKLRELEGKLEAALKAEKEAREQLEAALSPSAGGDDEADDGEKSELLIANRLQLATLQAREKELEDLGAELAEMRATLAKVDGDGSALSLSCTILAKEIDYSERSFEERIASERKLLQDALKAQVRAPCVRFKAAQTHKLGLTAPTRLRRRRGISASLSCVSQLFGCDGWMCGHVSCRHLSPLSHAHATTFTAQGARASAERRVRFEQVLHSSASDGDPDGMELALKEAEGREAELDTAQQQAHADLKRARTALAAAERKVEMGEHAAPPPQTTVSQESGRSWKEQKNAAAKLQARRRGHAARGAIQELHTPPPAAAGGGLPQSLTKRLQDADGAPRIVSKTRRADATSTAPEQLLESLTAVPELEASAPPQQLQQSLATVSLLEVALADPTTPAAEKPAMVARLSSAKAEVLAVATAAASASPQQLQQLQQSLATVSELEVALADPSMPAAEKPAMVARLSSAKADVALAAAALPSQPAAPAPPPKADFVPAVASAFAEMRSEMKLWAGGSLPAGKDSGVAEEAKLRKTADESLLRVESVLSVSELRNISQDLAHRERSAQSRADAVVAQLKADLQSASRRACAAFPAVAWAGPGDDFGLGGTSEVSHALSSIADFVERAAAMQEATRLAALEELEAARAEAAAAAAAAERAPVEDGKLPEVVDEPPPVDEVTEPPPPVEPPAPAPVVVAEPPHTQDAAPPSAAPVAAEPPPPAVVCEDVGCNPHASPEEVLRFMLHETGLLDPATREAALRAAGGPETELAKLVRMFQWDDKIRSYSEGAAATSSGHVDRPRSASLASIRLPSRKAALPPLAPDEMALWEQQLVVLKQRLEAEAERAAEAERRAKQLIAQLRAARQKAEAAEQPVPFSSDDATSDDVNQLRRLLSLMTPGLHGQRLPWSPRLTASGSPAVVHARAPSPTDKAREDEAPAQATEAANEGQSVFRRLHSRESRSSSRWQQRRADLQEEAARSTEAVMQAYASVRHTGAVFAQMRSRFDAPSEDPDPGAGSFDKLLARAQMTDPALPPVRRGGASAATPEPWGSRTGTPWQPVQSLGRHYDAIGSRTGQSSRPKTSSSSSSPASNPRQTPTRPVRRPPSVQRPDARGAPQLKVLSTSSTAPALY